MNNILCYIIEFRMKINNNNNINIAITITLSLSYYNFQVNYDISYFRFFSFQLNNKEFKLFTLL